MKSVTGILMVWLLAVALTALGCGVYTFNPKGKSEISSIAVERFENQTPEFGLADRMTDNVIDALISDGNLKVVSEEAADAILAGTLVRYERKPQDFTTEDQVLSYAIEMDFVIALKKGGTGSEIWKERMSQKGIYEVATQTEEDGQQEAIGFLVEAIINKTTRSW